MEYFDDRYLAVAKDLDEPVELGDCEVHAHGFMKRKHHWLDVAVKVSAVEEGYKLPTCKACDPTLDDCLEDARIEGAEMLSRRARAIALFKRAAVPAAFVAAAILQQVVCQ